MRINKWIAGQTGVGRRTVDDLIQQGRVTVDGATATMGQQIEGHEEIIIDGKHIDTKVTNHVTIMLHKPRGYVCSREGQGKETVYDLLPKMYSHLKIAGRLDKDSSGLLILSSDGDVIQHLTHPTLHKEKTYLITTRRPLTDRDLKEINTTGVDIGDERPSRFDIVSTGQERTYQAVLQEGRNRQIRRTIEALKNTVNSLHRTHIGEFSLGDLEEGTWRTF